ncbi:hypothetical protein [Nocardia asiatica]|uniref:hypothetical protein n=1 Tax=Nocardia asiatica TaxID=209252 RepID=UPI0012F84588|nr:hypothetical protein [Nocardia asiatica]
MTTASSGDDHGERPVDASEPDSGQPAPEWAPLEPLPSSQMFLSAFAGTAPLTAADILDPAFDLVACQTQYRLAFEVLGSDTASAEQLKHAATELVTAQADIEVLIAIINDSVADRLKQRLNRAEMATPMRDIAPIDGLPLKPVHTESIGEIAARMASLWETMIDKAKKFAVEEFPEAAQLIELCCGYDCLAAEIETGRRLPPGV